MTKVICAHRGMHELCFGCGAAVPHDPDHCEKCPIDADAKCIGVEGGLLDQPETKSILQGIDEVWRKFQHAIVNHGKPVEEKPFTLESLVETMGKMHEEAMERRKRFYEQNGYPAHLRKRMDEALAKMHRNEVPNISFFMEPGMGKEEHFNAAITAFHHAPIEIFTPSRFVPVSAQMNHDIYGAVKFKTNVKLWKPNKRMRQRVKAMMRKYPRRKKFWSSKYFGRKKRIITLSNR